MELMQWCAVMGTRSRGGKVALPPNFGEKIKFEKEGNIPNINAKKNYSC
jgi:hypothetical protein